MAKKLGHLFFSTLRRAAKIQRQAIQLTAATSAKKHRRSTRKATSARGAPVRPSRRTPTESLRPPGKGTWQSFTHAPPLSGLAAVGRLTYWLYRPPDHATAGLPLVIMLHGCQQTPLHLPLGSRMNQLADQKGFVVAYPQQAKRTQTMQCWRWYQPSPGVGPAEADAITDLALAVARAHRLDATRIYLAGLSAGASMAALVALRHPARFAAIALHSGAVLGSAHNGASGLRTMRRGSAGDPVEFVEPLVSANPAFPGMPAMILHGRRDHTVSMRNALQLTQQFNALNGVSGAKEAVLGRGTHREYARKDFLKNQRIAVRLCLLNEVDHAWSGGTGKVEFSSATGPRASLLIWQFFAMHRRPPAL